MQLTPRRLNRATLARQLLLRREPVDVVEGVRRVVALQAQEPASPYLALWNRVSGFDPHELAGAFDERAIVKATLMRITLHAVDARDYPVFHQAMLRNLRASRLYDRRYTATGLTEADAGRVLAPVIEFTAIPRTRVEIEEMLAAHLGEAAEPRLWWALKTFAPLIHAPGTGPWSFSREASFQAAPSRPERPVPDEALRYLIRRYLEGFGPASPADFARFALQRQSEIRPALDAMAGTLVEYEGPGGGRLLDVPDGPLPDEDVPAPPRLLGMWDSVLLAYADRSRIIPEEYRAAVIRRNGDVLATLLVDGSVAGVWRQVDGAVEVRAFRPLGGGDWDGIGSEAGALAAFLGRRDPAVYRRFAGWWDDLPDGETRRFPA